MISTIRPQWGSDATDSQKLTEIQKAFNDLVDQVNAIEISSLSSLKFGSVVLTQVPQASAVSLTTTVISNIFSFNLPAGTWSISGASSVIVVGGTTTLSNFRYGISVTSATFNASSGEAPMTSGEISLRAALTAAAIANSPISFVIPEYQFTLTTEQTFWLVVQAIFGAGTASGYGWIQATQLTKGSI